MPSPAGKAVSVPGKALAAVLARCGSSGSGARASSGLTPEALARVEAFYAQVGVYKCIVGGSLMISTFLMQFDR